MIAWVSQDSIVRFDIWFHPGISATPKRGNSASDDAIRSDSSVAGPLPESYFAARSEPHKQRNLPWEELNARVGGLAAKTMQP